MIRHQFFFRGMSHSLFLVRVIGIEPTWIAPLDPKSSASASFATPANWAAKVGDLNKRTKGIML